jgi:hypothetical protein
LEPTFSDKRNAKSPLPQHRSNTQSPNFALSQYHASSFLQEKMNKKKYSNKEQKQHWLPSPGYGHAFPDTMLTQTQQIIQLSKTKLQFRKTKKKQSKKLRVAHPRTYVIIDRSNAVKKQLAIISATNGWVWEGGNGKVSTGWRLVTKT